MTLEYGKPIRVFIGNLYFWGFRLWVDGDRLQVKAPADKSPIPPLLAEEIVRRAGHIKEVLKPFPAGPLQRYQGRLVTLREFQDALREADATGAKLRGTPVNGGWVVEAES